MISSEHTLHTGIGMETNSRTHRKLSMGELNRPTPFEYREKTKWPVTVVLENIRSCHNIGSVFRTADAMLVEKIFLCGFTATPPNKEIHKTALDAEKNVEWEYAENTCGVVERLKMEGTRVYAVEQTENSILLPLFHPEKEGKIALIFGNEVKGVSQEVIDRCDGVVEIPQFGTKHSFNISVSAGIVLWEITRKLAERSQSPPGAGVS